MLFNSFEFLILFLPVTLAISCLLRGNLLLAWVAISSLTFYAFAGHAWFLIPMAVTTILDYWIGIKLYAEQRNRPRSFLLILSLVGNLGLLAYFKYFGLFVRTAQELAGVLGHTWNSPKIVTLLSVALPAGISFYTFQTLSYVVDIYRRQCAPEKNFFKYLSFISFFPHLIAGPLTRHNQLLPQLGEIAKKGIHPKWKSGILLFSIGLVKKVLIADRIAAYTDPLIEAIAQQKLFACWLAMIGYSLQIYFDFSGYSEMAIGLGRLFSIELPVNFNNPYQSKNPSEFWRRWHITLSQWLRDYLYISLGGNRCAAWRIKLNLLITMVLGGLWHGANWTFAVWGLFHGLLLILYHKIQRYWDSWNSFLQSLLMYLLICVGWVFFRSPTLDQALLWLEGLVGKRGIEFSWEWPLPFLAAFLITVLAGTMLSRNLAEYKFEELSPSWCGALGIITAVAMIMMNYSSKFLYFQF